MTVHKTIEFSEDDAAFIDTAVAEGRFASPSDAVREALALLADAERIKALREAIAEGEASGFEEEAFDFDAFLDDLHGRR
ncbi:MAG: type II toxin-antitoxin system ParD family antitoxin [Salinarimonas sp.]